MRTQSGGLQRSGTGLTDWTVPRSVPHPLVLQAGCLSDVDERSPHPELTHDLVQRRLAHKKLFGGVS